ncbi:boophilin-G2-like [Mizuhopecten yessoensis]|uniref:BPTI/Kunitz domain-containing protein n=1 Tax=Mizuhopecten yessoensis TaxID=6573 RepID=A0A210Q860_MIZYE|nr:boophilin-G2-like [Mizuhopecten yessoensis]OWF44869.1 BPTI/Kunitz domain-containing protein [Mizuhopecten yessoensis]
MFNMAWLWALVWISLCMVLPMALSQRVSSLPNRCYREPEPASCKIGRPRYYFNVTTELCEYTRNTRCSGRRPTFFSTASQCMQRCGCRADADPGPCDGYSTRFYYNSRYRMCTPFVFGGCGGNFNNFKTFFECQWSCRPGFFSFDSDFEF